MNNQPLKWCTYCRKYDHNDSECWSTRPANWHPTQHLGVDIKAALEGANRMGLSERSDKHSKVIEEFRRSLDEPIQPIGYISSADRDWLKNAPALGSKGGVTIKAERSAEFNWPVYAQPPLPDDAPPSADRESDEPFCWVLDAPGKRPEISFAENVPGPNWKPLYTAPQSATVASEDAACKVAADLLRNEIVRLEKPKAMFPQEAEKIGCRQAAFQEAVRYLDPSDSSGATK